MQYLNLVWRSWRQFLFLLQNDIVSMSSVANRRLVLVFDAQRIRAANCEVYSPSNVTVHEITPGSHILVKFTAAAQSLRNL